MARAHQTAARFKGRFRARRNAGRQLQPVARLRCPAECRCELPTVPGPSSSKRLPRRYREFQVADRVASAHGAAAGRGAWCRDRPARRLRRREDACWHYVGALFPAHHVTVAQPSELTGNFNAHLQNALLIQVEEGFWAGDKSAEGTPKNLVTSETRMGPGAWPQRAVGIESRCPAFDPPPVAAGAGATPQRVRRFAGVRISRGVRDSAPA